MSSLEESIRSSIAELKRTKESIVSCYQATLYDVGGYLVMYTPLKTGLASSNWNVTNSGKGDPERQPEGSDKGYASMVAIGSQVSGLKVGSVAIFYNPVGYIDDLEGGTSRQAPNGIITPTLMSIDGLWVQNLERFKII